jgi:hypothetical protein
VLEERLPLGVEDVGIHGPGVEIDAEVESVRLVVEAHASSLVR